MDKTPIHSFREFYPYYLNEHRHPVNRLLHITGTLLLIAVLLVAVFTQRWWMFAILPLIGYGFAWVGHFFIEKNKPATFTHPFYSLASDFLMCWHFVTGQLKTKMEQAA